MMLSETIVDGFFAFYLLVLILVLVEDAPGGFRYQGIEPCSLRVLILVVMDDSIGAIIQEHVRDQICKS